MKQTLLLILLTSALLAGCTSHKNWSGAPYVPWEDASLMLEHQDVREIFTTHKRSVRVELKDGTLFWSKSPEINTAADILHKRGLMHNQDFIWITE